MSQPVWKFIANLGDASPLDYGGLFIYQDETGLYCAEMTLLEPLEEAWETMNRCYSCQGTDSPCGGHIELVFAHEYRIQLEQCTLTDGVLSDNKFHPLHPAWFATPETERANRPQDTTYLSNVADSCGQTVEQLQEALCSDDILVRAHAYKALIDYHGVENFDSYPNVWTVGEYAELKARFAVETKG